MRVGVSAVLALSILLAAGCHKKQPVATVPAPVPAPSPIPVSPPPAPSAVALEAANREYGLGDYVSAARDFGRYLELVPSGGSRDQALFSLGVIYTLPAQQDWQRAGDFLKQLMSEFPRSPLRLPAQLILSIRDQAVQLSGDVSRLTNEASQLRSEATRLRNSSVQSEEKVGRLMAEVDQLKSQAAEREQKIRQLTTDLERLIKIDSQNRPRPQF